MRANTPLPSGSRRLEIGIQKGDQLRLGNGTLVTSHDVTIPEQNQGRDSLNMKSVARDGIAIHFKFSDVQSIAVCFCSPAHQWSDQAARATPGSPKIDQNRSRRLKNVRVKTGISEISYGNSQSGWDDYADLMDNPNLSRA